MLFGLGVGIELIIFGLVFTVISGITNYFVYKNIKRMNYLKKFGMETVGTIVDYKKVRNYSKEENSNIKRYKYYALVEFQVEGETYSVYIYGGHFSNRSIGREVVVIYDPQNPEKAMSKQLEASSWILYIFLVFIPIELLFGLGLLIVGILISVKL